MKINVYSAFNGKLENIWKEFEERAIMTPFQSWAWLAHWYKLVGGPLLEVVPQVVHIHDKGETLAILPLNIRKTFGVRLLEWLGGINTDYMGPLIHPDFKEKNGINDLWPNIINRLNKYDAIHFQKQLNKTVQFLIHIGFKSNFNNHLDAFQFTLPSNWEKYYNTKSSKTRATDRRKKRNLTKFSGEVKFITGHSYSEKKDIFECMVKQKRRRYRETKVWDMLAVEEYQKFYQGLVDINSEKFKIHYAALMGGDVAVATHIGIIDGSTFYFLMPANEGEQYGKYSPGRLLLLELLKWSIANRLNIFDFTVGGDNYKNYWCDSRIKLFEMLKPMTVKGNAFLLGIKIIQGIKNNPWLNKKGRQLRSWLIIN